jgi:hypothetical protein
MHTPTPRSDDNDRSLVCCELIAQEVPLQYAANKTQH